MYKSIPATQASLYEQLYKLQFGNNKYITIAEMKSPTLHRASLDENLSMGKDSFSCKNFSLVIVKNIHGPDTKTQLQSIRQIQHEKFLHLQELFLFESMFLAIFKFMLLSLQEIAHGNPLLNEI
ncbi:hypothetical protein B0T25DRAFT_466982 [Lasiosphaeria hispida]|uniref:Uncharacterized protein n=1 Tax=Lasiosphaeria hispida TaxID=260671 RepID=A0AAJ0H5C5_9PEZI|nr:hypothetical protein B0T25DRAFT_466982 [Lasiosphaeria hispida]